MRKLYFVLVLLFLATIHLNAQADTMDNCPDFRTIIDVELLLKIAEEKIEKTFTNPREINRRKYNTLNDLKDLDYKSFNKCIEMFAQIANCEEISRLTLFQFYLFDSDIYKFYLVIYTYDDLDYYYYGDLYTGEVEFKGIRSGMHLDILLQFYLESTTESQYDSHYLYLTYIPHLKKHWTAGSKRMDFCPKFSIYDLNVIEISMDALLNPSVRRK